MEKIVLLGFGGHAKSIIDTIETLKKYEIVGISDVVEKQGERYRKYSVAYQDEQLEYLFDAGIKNLFISVGYMGNSHIRNELFLLAKKIGYSFPPIIDPTAIVAKDVIIEEGVFIGKSAIVNADAKIHKMAIINTGSIIEHESEIGDFTHIAVGTVICGQANIGNNSFVGSNATIIQNIQVGNDVIIGAGCVVRKNLENGCLYTGG